MTDILVVFYSYTGVSRRVAQLLSSHHGFSLGEIHEVKHRAGALGGLRCVLDSLLGRHPAIRYEGPDPADCRAVVIVSPIWAYQMAGPMRSFLREYKSRIHRYAQVTVMNAAGASNAVAEAARLMGSAPVMTGEFLSRRIEDGTGTGDLLEFGDALVHAVESPASRRAAAWTPVDAARPVPR